MYKHGKYSKLKERKPYTLIETVHRYDGVWTHEYFYETFEQAEEALAHLKSIQPQPNEYYFGSEYEIVMN